MSEKVIARAYMNQMHFIDFFLICTHMELQRIQDTQLMMTLFTLIHSTSLPVVVRIKYFFRIYTTLPHHACISCRVYLLFVYQAAVLFIEKSWKLICQGRPVFLISYQPIISFSCFIADQVHNYKVSSAKSLPQKKDQNVRQIRSFT